jgi:hypothetical protein
MKPIPASILKIILLTVIMFILWAGFVGLFMNLFGGADTPSPPSTNNTGTILVAMLIVSLVNTSIVSYAISRAAWRGLRLASAVTLQIFGIQFVLSFSEALYFDSRLDLPGNFAIANLLGGACMAAGFALAAIAVFGRMKQSAEPESPLKRPPMPWPEFVGRFLVLAAVVYPLIYFLAGYFIAFQSEAVRIYYTLSPERVPLLVSAGDFWGKNLHMFQIARGALWIAIGLPVIRMLKTKMWETAIVVGLLFALLMNTQHLLPNPHMPSDIRLVHFIETALSNFMWGIVVTLVMQRPLAISMRSRSPHPSRVRTP